MTHRLANLSSEDAHGFSGFGLAVARLGGVAVFAAIGGVRPRQAREIGFLDSMLAGVEIVVSALRYIELLVGAALDDLSRSITRI